MDKAFHSTNDPYAKKSILVAARQDFFKKIHTKGHPYFVLSFNRHHYMKRVIKHIASLDDALLELMENQFPNGIRREDLLSLPTPQGKRLQGLELQTPDVIYFIRIPSLLALQQQRQGPKIDYSLSAAELMDDD